MTFESKGKNELYIGNLSKDVTQEDIESVFQKHGKITRCDMKNKGYGPVYAFIEFDDERDAEDAMNAEDGKDMCGSSMVVKYSKGKDNGGDRRGGGGGGYGGDRGYGGGRGGGGRGGYGGGGGGGGRGFGDRGGGGRGPLTCYECGGEGHFARDCPRRGGGGGGGGGGDRRGGGGASGRSDFRRGGGGGDRYGGGPPRRDRSGDRSPRDRSRERYHD